MRKLQAMLLKECFGFLDAAPEIEVKVGYPSLVLLFRKLLIEKHIFLFGKIHGSKAIPASSAAIEERRVAAVAAILCVAEVVALRTVDALVAQFAVVDETAIDAIAAVIHEVTVVAVLVVIRSRDEVAVPVPAGIIDVVAVLIRLQ